MVSRDLAWCCSYALSSCKNSRVDCSTHCELLETIERLSEICRFKLKSCSCCLFYFVLMHPGEYVMDHVMTSSTPSAGIHLMCYLNITTSTPKCHYTLTTRIETSGRPNT